MRGFVLGSVLCLATAALAAGQQGLQVGEKLTTIQLTDPKGKQTTYRLDGAISAVIFTSVQCPVSNAYNERMASAYQDYHAKGVHFFFVNANSTETGEAVNEHARRHFPFPVYKDMNNVVADRLGATVTPEAFVFGKDGTLLYHGSIDDSQVLERVSDHRLRTALDEALAGQPIAKAQTKAFGCSIKRARKES